LRRRLPVDGGESVSLRAKIRALADDKTNLALAPLALGIFVACWWGLPNTDTWSADSVSPRTCGLGAIVETYWPGHFHNYPPLHTAILTVFSLPWILLAMARVGTSPDALNAELVKPLYMTAIEASARLVAAAMALATVWLVKDLWTRLVSKRAGVVAALIVATNATYVYYAHLGNLEVPYLFWLALALREMDRVMCGEAREKHVMLIAAAAALTKDQAAAALLIPIPVALALVPKIYENKPIFRRNLIVSVALAAAVFALASGMVTNPSGYHKRLDYLFGPASKPWAEVPPGAYGSLLLMRDAIFAISKFTSWPIAIAAAIGLGLAMSQKRGVDRARILMPAIAATSFWIFFNLGARRTEDRFLLPASLFLLPYASVLFDVAAQKWNAFGTPMLAALSIASAPAIYGVVVIDASMLEDPRYAAEKWLEALPAGAHVEVYGSAQYLPRLPSHLIYARPGIEPLGDRRLIPNVTEILDRDLDPAKRNPKVIVLATELSTEGMTSEVSGPLPPSWMAYRDPKSHAFFRGLRNGALGYDRTFVATCALPRGAACREIHHSTGGEVWIYERR
ncbi:MAG: ArnT family glycosyltransferase, partial [Polyangiaceae bacterium]